MEQRRNRGGGYLYVITNPAWPGWCKIGRTTNIRSRLRTYQTGSPLRDYHLHYHRWVRDVVAAEEVLKNTFKGTEKTHEWHRLHPDDAANLLDFAARRL